MSCSGGVASVEQREATSSATKGASAGADGSGRDATDPIGTATWHVVLRCVELATLGQ